MLSDDRSVSFFCVFQKWPTNNVLMMLAPRKVEGIRNVSLAGIKEDISLIARATQQGYQELGVGRPEAKDTNVLSLFASTVPFGIVPVPIVFGRNEQSLYCILAVMSRNCLSWPRHCLAGRDFDCISVPGIFLNM